MYALLFIAPIIGAHDLGTVDVNSSGAENDAPKLLLILTDTLLAFP